MMILRLPFMMIKGVMFSVIFLNQLVQLALIIGGGIILWNFVIVPFVIEGS